MSFISTCANIRTYICGFHTENSFFSSLKYKKSKMKNKINKIKLKSNQNQIKSNQNQIKSKSNQIKIKTKSESNQLKPKRNRNEFSRWPSATTTSMPCTTIRLGSWLLLAVMKNTSYISRKYSTCIKVFTRINNLFVSISFGYFPDSETVRLNVLMLRSTQRKSVEHERRFFSGPKYWIAV